MKLKPSAVSSNCERMRLLLIINADELRELLDINEIMNCAEIALKEFSSSRTITPIRSSLSFFHSQNTALVMPSVAEELGIIGLKIVTVAPGNKKLGMKTINGIVILSDFETGEPVALFEGSFLTMVRTGALSGVATKYLAREDAKKLCIIGTGVQAKGIIEAILAVRDIDTIMIYNRTEQKAIEFAEYLRKKFNKVIQLYTDPNEAIRDADVIVTATNSNSPVFTDSLKEGAHLNAVGSFRPSMQELSSHVISSADKVIVESIEAALEETGDLQIPIKEGVFKESDIYGELGEIVSGEKSGRESDQEITIFKSVGLAIVDIVVAKYFYDKALRNNLGVRVDF